MKVLLIVPRYGLTTEKNYQYTFPIGLSYISAVLKKAGHNVDCLNLNHKKGLVRDLIIEKLNDQDYDIACTGHTGIGYSIVEKIVNSIREHKSNPKIILGGALMTSEPELMIKSLKPDFAVLGEGEKTIVELLDALENKEEVLEIKGIGYLNKENKLILTAIRPPIEDIDSIPFSDFEGLGFNEYLDYQSNEANFNIIDYPRSYWILCSRGCPYQCTFCYHSIGFKYRARSLDSVFKEIREAIKKYKINSLSIQDDLFAINKERVYDFCKRIKNLSNELGWEIKWSCQLTVNNTDKELLKKIKESGCSVVSFGFESYSQEVLKSMKKPITPEQIKNTIKLTLESGIGLQGSFIFGDSAETKKSAYETLNFWKNNCRGQIKLGFIQPYPGSEIYKKCIEKGIIKDKLSFIKNKMSHTNWINMADNMSDKEISQLKKDILEARRKYYPYTITKRIKKQSKDKYELKIQCPFCKKEINYENCFIENRFHYNLWIACRNCHMRVCVTNRLYKFQADYYQELDFLRRNYLILRDILLKKKT